MNARTDFSPINVGKVLPAHPMVHASLLEPARVQPCYEGMDDTAAYAQTLPSHIKLTDYDALVTRQDCRETTLRRMVNIRDTHDALEFLHERGEFPELWERLEEVEMEMAEKRLNRGQA